MPDSTLTSDALVVAPISATLTGNALVVTPPFALIYGDARVTGPYNVPYCGPYNEVLVEGVDYELDSQNGRIRFLSSGRLSNQEGVCAVRIDFCCQSPYCAYLENPEVSCMGACYIKDGYDTVLQEGAEAYRSDDEKMMKRATLEAEPLPASTPAPLECDVAFGNQPSCMTWKPVRPLEFECQSNKSAAQHQADRTRPDDGFHFPTWIRGKYLSVRFRITGIGGGGMFSAIHKLVKGWGQFDAP